ncbi:MAG: sensor histidine kinase [Planctomycetota bacterium]
MHAETPLKDGQPVASGDWDVQAAHRARLLQAGQMLATVVHEINNPLAVIQGYAQLMQERARSDEDRADLNTILDETKRLATLIEDMLAFTRRETDRVERVDLGRAVAAAVNLTAHAMRQARVAVVAILPREEFLVRGSHGAIVQVLMNLLVNARQSLESGGPPEGRGIAISAHRSPTGCIELLVSNNGPAIPAAVAARIFEPFFTTKAKGEGSGLGLSLCRDLLSRFEASITLDPPDGAGGVTFRLVFQPS